MLRQVRALDEEADETGERQQDPVDEDGRSSSHAVDGLRQESHEAQGIPGEALPEDTKTFGIDAPTKSPISLQDLVGILSTIGRDLTGNEPVKSPWAGGPAQDRHAAAKAAVQKGSFPTGPGSVTGKYTGGQVSKGLPEGILPDGTCA